MSNIDTDPQYLIQNNAETSPKIHHFQQIMFNRDDETYIRRNATHFVKDSRCSISHLKPPFLPNIVDISVTYLQWYCSSSKIPTDVSSHTHSEIPFQAHEVNMIIPSKAVRKYNF